MILYVKNGCPPCQRVKDHIEKYGLNVTTINLTDEPKYINRIKDAGARTVPALMLGTTFITESDEIIGILGE